MPECAMALNWCRRRHRFARQAVAPRPPSPSRLERRSPQLVRAQNSR